MRKLQGYDLDTARREAPGPWRIGGRDDAGIHVLDANGERVATIWKTPSRSVAALEAIQALVVRMGDEVLATRRCANPECRRPVRGPQPDAEALLGCVWRGDSATCHRGPQARPVRDQCAYELRMQGLTWKEVAQRSSLRDGKRAHLGARKHARRNGLTLPTHG